MAMTPAPSITARRSEVAAPSRGEGSELRRALDTARAALLSWRKPEGCWHGELSSSALATATAVSAFAAVSRERFAGLVGGGAAWLAAHQNGDGGWGDTPESPSNISTTLLVEAAILLSGQPGPETAAALRRAEPYLRAQAGDSVDARIRALQAVYGEDLTFAAPILANCALAPAPEPTRVAWRDVPALPLELACLPQACFRWLNLGVVSYALPALIAIGQVRHTRQPSRNPFVRALRSAAAGPALRRLETIQPASGGFLEATPLTSFVVMSLAGAGRSDHPVARRGLEFLSRSVRADGSWPIDTDLSHWLTSLSVAALAAGGDELPFDPAPTRRWILECQHRRRHPYTGAAAGGWAWTDASGGVPDADDTAAALVALRMLEPEGEKVEKWEGGKVRKSDFSPSHRPTFSPSHFARMGVGWLLGLQNRDGGWPTFCRGWGRLPFDCSAPDLTAHALRAIAAWHGAASEARGNRAMRRGFEYLRRVQRPDGAWVPLWFGNQQAPRRENPVYGTSRVLAAYRDLGRRDSPEAHAGAGWLAQAQGADGGWGGDRGVPSSIEESALAVDALAGWRGRPDAAAACRRGCEYLIAPVRVGGLDRPAPIGLYFAKLWYAEKVYPALWTVSALGRMSAEGPPR